MQISFLGASGTVTGSRYLIQSGRRRLLVDCGLFQGFKQLRLRNWSAPTFDPQQLNAVVLTHAHIDHSGYLPALWRRGFRGPIFCSPGTHELCRVLLPDSAHLQEEEARYANRHGFSKHKPALPLYTHDDVEQCLKLFRALTVGELHDLGGEVSLDLHPSGHLLGACYVRVHAEGKIVTFSGDVGRPNDPVMKPAAPLLPTDYLVTESTYGDRQHPEIDPETELGEWLSQAVARGGTVVVPAFAVGRTQALLLHIARLKEKGKLPDVPVFIDSPMAIDATGLYLRFNHEHRLSEADCRRMCLAATIVNTPEDSKELDRLDGPTIIISASGMATGGRVVHHLKAFLGDPRNLILFGGYQSPGSRGGVLVSGAQSIRIHGEDYAVRAQIGQLLSSSSHADANELLAWLRGLQKPPLHTFVTHGEPSASDRLRYRIEHELGWNATAPDYRDVFDTATGEYHA